MLDISKWVIDSQMFGGEGAGSGAGAGTGDGSADGGPAMGVTSDAASQTKADRLRELGVPDSKIKKRQKWSEPVEQTDTTQNADGEGSGQLVTDNTQQADGETTAPKRMTWEEIMADPEYNKNMQETMQKRLMKSKQAEESLGKLQPALELLTSKYGLDINNLDYEALNKAISDDDSYYEDKALEMGVDVETARKLDNLERDAARQERIERQTAQEEMIQNHLVSLERQGEELKQTFPGFDLRTELQNPVFARMTAPGGGISVADAYYAVHRNEIQTAAMQITAQRTAEKMSNAIMSNSRRPAEAGASSQAPSVTSFNYKNMSRAQREALKANIRKAAANGQKIYPGQR